MSRSLRSARWASTRRTLFPFHSADKRPNLDTLYRDLKLGQKMQRWKWKVSAVTAIQGMNVTVFCLQLAVAANLDHYLVQPNLMIASFAIWPVTSPAFGPWQLLTYGFLHGGVVHLGLQVLSLSVFGPSVEKLLGRARFALYYALCIVGGGLAHVSMLYYLGTSTPAIGASGAVYGVVAAFGLTSPNRPVWLLLPLPVALKAKYIAAAFVAVDVLGFLFGHSGIAYDVHLGGLVTGMGLMSYWRLLR